MCLLGDGTTNIGAFHESLNLAGLWQLPIVYVIVNNRLGMGTPVEAASAEPELYKRGCSYRIPGNGWTATTFWRSATPPAPPSTGHGRERQPGLTGGGQLPASRPLGGGPGHVPPREDTERLRRSTRARVPPPAVSRRRPRRRGRAGDRRRGRQAGRRRRGLRRRQPRPESGRFRLRYATPVPSATAACPATRSPGGRPAMTVISYRQALHDTLRAELLRDESVFLIGEEIGVFEGSYKITAGLLAEFGPRRVRDTPICEEGFVGAAIGAAMLGLRPVVEIMTINFSLLAIDQIVNHAAKMQALFGGQVSVPLVIRTPGGGGQQLAATHSQNLEVWYAHVPGLKVVAPATSADAKALLAAAIRDDDPVLVLENLALYNTKGEVPDGEQIARDRPAAVLKPGRDLTVVGYSRATVIALDVARQLEADGVSIEVIDLRSLRPLDRETICASVRKTSRAVILEDDWLSYGSAPNSRRRYRRCVRLSRCPSPPGRRRGSAPAVREAARARRPARRRR